MNEKSFEITIRDTPHEFDTCYFSFNVVKIINNKYTAFTDSLKCPDGGFYIYDLDIKCFLWYFLKKSFEPDNKYNLGTANITMPVHIYDLLKMGLMDDKVMGVVINPFGKPYAMAKDMLKAFLDRYEEWAKEEGIEMPGMPMK